MTDERFKAIYLDDRYTVLDHGDPAGFLRHTPGDAFGGGLAGLLDTLSARFGDEGVVILGVTAVKALRMPTITADDQAGAATVAELARGGWQCGQSTDWTTCTKPGRPKLHVLNTAVMDVDDCPLWTGYTPDAVRHFRLWHELTGSAWRLGTAAAGLAVMSDLDKARAGAKGAAPPVTWKVKNGPDGPDSGFEGALLPTDWRAPRPDRPLPYLHLFDKARAYIAAAALTEVSPWALRHTGRIAFSSRRAGWWQIEIAPWNLAHMPDPAGYVGAGPEDPRRLVRWVTTPTLGLLEELTSAGVYGGARILDSWTGPARDFPLKAYSERMRDAYELRDPQTGAVRVDLDELEKMALKKAVKKVGHKTFGALDSASNWAYRPHWWHSIVAMNRCNMWRAAWKIGSKIGVWPAWFETDAVWYPSVHADPVTAAGDLSWRAPDGRPTGIVIDETGTKLGTFTPKNSRKLKGKR